MEETIELKAGRLEKVYIDDNAYLLLPVSELKKGKTWNAWQYSIASGVFVNTSLKIETIQSAQEPVQAEICAMIDLMLEKNMIWNPDEHTITEIKAEEEPDDPLNEVPLELFKYEFKEKQKFKCSLSINAGRIRFSADALLKCGIDEKKTIAFLHDRGEKNIYLQIREATSADKTVVGNLFYTKSAASYFIEKFGANPRFEIKEKIKSVLDSVFLLKKI